MNFYGWIYTSLFFNISSTIIEYNFAPVLLPGDRKIFGEYGFSQ